MQPKMKRKSEPPPTTTPINHVCQRVFEEGDLAAADGFPP